MKTSYFSKSGHLEKVVSIARGVPIGWKGRQYLNLAPPWELINQYKTDKNESLYNNHYKHLVLDKLNPEKVYNELGDDAILLCWEKSNTFCHRYIVAEWFYKNLQIEVEEL